MDRVNKLVSQMLGSIGPPLAGSLVSYWQVKPILLIIGLALWRVLPQSIEFHYKDRKKELRIRYNPRGTTLAQ